MSTLTHTSVTCTPATPKGIARELADLVLLWLERYRQRRDLAGLDDHLLKDIGISRADAWQESAKPFWRE
ncbi:DUF1127 domain-containing protein [Geminicoccaceae bacterium 1502E]|nr:DUF1127 domain-containing protein [Geminicoccaceae bacterium 1502E]